LPSRWEVTKAVRTLELPAPALMGLSHLKVRWTRVRQDVGQRGLVYYLERGDGAIKIGTTCNYPARRDDLRGRHGPLTLLAWEFGSFDAEYRRHQQFANLRIGPVAEWFRAGPELIAHVLALREVLTS
jgi:hypothetical protein